ncbi:MAG: MucB/RseB C-terminal domain-containing protein [Gammaproteobacteria bacterium]|nr:MucB/RseB C-terminal domain-containing protein [Gammaproteobacteria bacterium]
MRRPFSLGFCCFVCLISLAGSFQAYAEDPRDWLTDMNRAFTELSYDGIFSFYSGSDLASVRIVHMLIDGEQRERLIHLTGAPREFIRRGEEVDCILMPGDDLLALESSIPTGPFARAFVRRYDNISKYYGLSFSGEDRIAGRLAVRLAITPLDENRYGYRLWLDKETRLLLQSELVDREGSKLEIFQFNQLKLGAEVMPAALEPAKPQGYRISHLSLAANPTLPVTKPQVLWKLNWLPAGFEMSAAEVRSTPSKLKSVNTMMYTDGLAAFSVFIEDMPPAGAASMVSRNGATVAVTHLTTGPRGSNFLVTLVGELPTSTAQRIAKSIRFNTPP